jgi:hypothetical protein
MKIIYVFLISLIFFVSCAEFSEEAERRLEDLREKTNSLDSLITREVDKVMTLDSIIEVEGKKVQRLDSIINETTTKFDSIRNERTRVLEELFN